MSSLIVNGNVIEINEQRFILPSKITSGGHYTSISRNSIIFNGWDLKVIDKSLMCFKFGEDIVILERVNISLWKMFKNLLTPNTNQCSISANGCITSGDLTIN